ncbi:MAG: GGDEF domain-containing protein [Nitriliruptoraceae bacterium]
MGDTRRLDGVASVVMIVLGGSLAVVTAQLAPIPALQLRFVLVLSGIVGLLVGVARYRPAISRPWLLLALGMASSAMGDVLVLVASRSQEMTANLPADAWLTAISGALIFAAMFDATRAVRGSEVGSTLDALVVALAGGVLIWHLGVVPAAVPGWAGSGTEVAGALQILLYVGVMGLLVRTIRSIPRGERYATTVLVVALMAALAAFLLGALRDAAEHAGSHYAGSRAAFGAIANLLVGAAAMHPSMRALTVRRVPPADRLTVARTVALGLALACPPLVFVASSLRGTEPSVLTLGVAWAVLVPAVMFRLYALSRSRDAAQQRAVSSERRLSAMVAHTSDVLLLVRRAPESGWVMSYASPAAERVLGLPPDSMRGASLSAIVLPDDRDVVEGLLADDADLPAASDVRIHGGDGEQRWMSVVIDAMGDSVADRVVTLRDVTDRKRSELRLEREANRDALTGLANRRAIESHIEAALESEPGDRIGVLVADLDGFKPVNDTDGHAIGDEVLRVVARRMRGALRGEDIVGRFGGDEFVVVCGGLGEPNAIEDLAARLIALVSEPIRVDGAAEPINVGLSIGMAIGTPERDSLARLLRRADVALYDAKRSGRGRASWANDDGEA